MRVHKDFKWSGIELSLFAEILNLLNLNEPNSVFLGSGNPDLPNYLVSKGAISPESYPSSHPLYSGRADANNDGLLDPDERFAAYQRLQGDMLALMPNYPLPRRAMFGVELRF
jgi:hypothetical protein